MTNAQAKRLVLAHWKRMLKLSVEDIESGEEAPTSDNCAFCRMYVKQSGNCDGCPVMNKTGKRGCHGTPFSDASILYFEIMGGEHQLINYFYRAVEKEIKFLESLDV